MKIIKKLMALGVVVFVAASAQGGFAQEMKIGVAAQAPQADARISEVAARAPYFLIFDGQGGLLMTLENPDTSVVGGAGQKAADLLHAHGVTIFVAGRVGGRMQNALAMYSIVIHEKTGVAHEAVHALIMER
jgi:predicted Fe-Mo cluster-binding NifX family protein